MPDMAQPPVYPPVNLDKIEGNLELGSLTEATLKYDLFAFKTNATEAQKLSASTVLTAIASGSAG